MSAQNHHFSAAGTPALTPFWHRLPRFFLYPLQLGSMLRIAGFSVFGGISLVIAPLFGGLLNLLLWIAFLKYAFLVLEHTARGHLEEPGHAVADTLDEHTASVIKQFVLFAVAGGAGGVLSAKFGLTGLVLSGLVLSLIMPAGIMIIAISGSLLQALHPGRIFFLVRTIGSPYLALYFFLASLTGGSAWLQGFLLAHLDSWVVLPLLTFVELYFTLIMYHMMGYALYQYHESLGLKVAVDFDRAEAGQAAGPKADPILLKLNALMAQGEHEQAIDVLEGALRIRWQDNNLHDRYQKLLLAAERGPTALRHGREYIGKLVNEKRMGRAMDLCEECLALDPEFQLQDPAQVRELARAAQLAQRPKLALRLVRGFDQRHPKHPHVPAVLLLYAQILSEHYHKDKEALLVLRSLLARFPEHALASEARQYQAVLEKLGAE
jgi:tetratricopeptide (TPR) repeat protein